MATATTIHGLCAIHREELMDVMVQLQTLNGGLMADNRDLRGYIGKLKREIDAHKANALDLAGQLDQQRSCYWQAADEHRREKEALQATIDRLQSELDGRAPAESEPRWATNLMGFLGVLFLAAGAAWVWPAVWRGM